MPKHFYYALRRISRGIIAKKILNADGSAAIDEDAGLVDLFIQASDMFFVQAMCEDYGGRSGNYWVGLLSAGYFLPQVITILGSIFYEAWQLSAVTEEQDREVFFSKIFRIYASVLFCCVAGVIWLCRPMMHLFKAEYYDGWIFVPFLTLCSMCTCLNQFLNSIYVVYKRSCSSVTAESCQAS